MTTMAPAGEGGGGGGAAEQAPTTSATTSTPGQQQHPPPSPLSGCYLLVVLPEPHTAQHKDLILNRLAKGLLSIFSSCRVHRSYVRVDTYAYGHLAVDDQYPSSSSIERSEYHIRPRKPRGITISTLAGLPGAMDLQRVIAPIRISAL